MLFFFFQAEDGIRDIRVTGVQTCALPIFSEVEEAAEFGISTNGSSVDFGKVGDRRRKVVKTLTGGVSGLFKKNKIDLIERSEEHTSELQSRQYLVCRLLLEKKKNMPISATCY